MSDATTNVPTKSADEKSSTRHVPVSVGPLETLRREVDRLFEEVGNGFWHSPFHRSGLNIEPFRRDLSLGTLPAVDISETDKVYELTVELPGMDEKQVEIDIANGNLMISGEKSQESEQKRKDFYLRERHYGAFHRSFRVPEDVEVEKIAAAFKKGVLTVTLPKSEQAQKPARKIDVKAG